MIQLSRVWSITLKSSSALAYGSRTSIDMVLLAKVPLISAASYYPWTMYERKDRRGGWGERRPFLDGLYLEARGLPTPLRLRAPVRRAYPGRGHNTAERYYQSLMYIGPRTSDALHKAICCIGPGLCELRRIPKRRSSQNPKTANFTWQTLALGIL
jgi:hypothetical protein